MLTEEVEIPTARIELAVSLEPPCYRSTVTAEIARGARFVAVSVNETASEFIHQHAARLVPVVHREGWGRDAQFHVCPRIAKVIPRDRRAWKMDRKVSHDKTPDNAPRRRLQPRQSAENSERWMQIPLPFAGEDEGPLVIFEREK